MRIRLFLLVVSACLIAGLHAQEKSKIKFGNVTPDDLKRTVYEVDSLANAVIIADIGSSEFVGNSKGGFSIQFKRFIRAHVLNKNGYDAANVVIPIYTDEDGEEQLVSLKAYAYNLQDGKVVETKLDTKDEVFKEKLDKHWALKKFTFPNVREGSILEYEYKLKSDFIFNLQPWEFQGKYPRLWSEYVVGMPQFYSYVTLLQGYQPFYLKDQKNKSATFVISKEGEGISGASERLSFTANITDFRWVMKNVPAMKEESYTSTIKNHLARIEFQLSEYRDPYLPKNVMGTWTDLCTELLQSENFGVDLTRDNAWMSDVIKEATNGASGDLETAKGIYNYLRDHLTCTKTSALKTEKSLKSVFKDRNGSEAEINLLLTAMLLKAGIRADPMLLSTRSHGFAYEKYPLIDRFNYVVTRLSINDRHYFLDASRPGLGFGKLGYDCYNGHARVINADATPVTLRSDSLMEKRMTSVLIINDESGKLVGTFQKQPGYYDSYNLRSVIREKGKDQYFDDVKKGFNAEIDIKAPVIDSLDSYEEPLRVKFDFSLNGNKEDIIYFNPMFSEGWRENPFKSAIRTYPVEMPYALDETYLLRLEIPKGYVLDELPKQVLVKLNDRGDGMFEYRITESGGNISLRSRITLNRAIYAPEEYELLREFFNLVVKKQNEQIVFKKKS
jgi:hypothetical protein